MFVSSPASTELLEELTNQPIFHPIIEQDLKRQPFFQAQDFNQMPVLHRQRVSQKLLQNRLRRLQLNMQKQQQLESLIQRKKVKEREIFTNVRNRIEKANRKKEENLRQSCSQQENRRRGEEVESREKLRRYQANLQKIEKGREKAEEKKTEYIFRIHRRTEENLRKAREKRRVMESMEQAENDHFHLQEWNSYKEKIVHKHQGRERSPPDRLYQEFKERNDKLKRILAEAVHQEESQAREEQGQVGEGQEREGVVVSCVSAKSLMGRGKRAEYFGIHQENMMVRTVKELEKMRRFLQNEGSEVSVGQSQQAYVNFKAFFMEEILHR